MIKILIADDHAIVREGLKRIITETSDMSVTGEASCGQEVLSILPTQQFDLIILDISMPGKSGLEILKQIKTDFPEIPVLILSVHPEDQYAVRVLKAGASGYLTKESASAELIDAIRKVSQGRRYVTQSLAEELAFNLTTHNKKPSHETLSDREFEVMCSIASGRTVTEIADSLYLSVKTISTYRSRILTKMKLKSNAELTHYAIKNNLV